MSDWEDVLPPPELTAFLRGFKLQQYDVNGLAALGYDDVDDFKRPLHDRYTPHPGP